MNTFIEQLTLVLLIAIILRISCQTYRAVYKKLRAAAAARQEAQPAPIHRRHDEQPRPKTGGMSR